MSGAATRFLVVLLGVGALALPARAQDTAQPEAGGVDTAEQLVERIKKQMAEVDEALAKAAEVDDAADEVTAAKRSHLAVIRDIEALIKQVKYQQSNSPSGGGGGQGGSGEQMSGSPQSQPSDGSSAPTPKGGKSKDGQTKSGEEQGKDGAEQKDGKQPQDSGQKDQNAGGNESASKLPPEETSRFTRTDTDARWGVLPPKLQERLNNLQVDDVPERYRAWLEAYIHALNSREQAGRSR